MGNNPLAQREWPFVDGLEPWLDVATKGLCAEAVERVCREMVAHCVESLDEKLASGMPLAQADREVMAALGSPRAARRAFRKTNLTYYEQLRLQVLTGAQATHSRVALPILVLMYLLVLGTMVTTFLLILPENPNYRILSHAYTTTIIFILIALPMVLLPVLRHKLGEGQLLRLIRWFALGQLGFTLLILPSLIFRLIYMHADTGDTTANFLLNTPISDLIVLTGGLAFFWTTWRLQYKINTPGGVAKQ